jgi:hypothetical protein
VAPAYANSIKNKLDRFSYKLYTGPHLAHRKEKKRKEKKRKKKREEKRRKKKKRKRKEKKNTL